MDFNLPEELELLKHNLHRFIDYEVISVERECCPGEEMIPQWREKFEQRAKDLGIWMMEAPEEYGGLGLGILPRVVVWEELSRTIAFPARGRKHCGAVRARHPVRAKRRAEGQIFAAGSSSGEEVVLRADRALTPGQTRGRCVPRRCATESFM